MPIRRHEITVDAGMLLCAFRYALGRRTYVVSEVTDWLKIHWDAMAPWHKQIHDDITHAIEHGIAGDDCDVKSWREILELPRRGAGHD
jgi:hypothetical protein